MTAFDDHLVAILQDPLAHVRDADRVIGYLGFDLPHDLLCVPGFAACHLPWRVGGHTPRADQWLESSFAPHLRSIVEDWADGRFDFMEAVIFSRGDDSVQRLYYYLADLQRTGEIGGPPVLIYDLAVIQSPHSEARCIDALRSLGAQLSIDAEALSAGIRVANQQRRWLVEAQAERGAPSVRYERIARASLFAPLDQQAVPHGIAVPTGQRILLAGSPPPDDWLHRVVDLSGGAIVGEAHSMSLLRLGALVAEDGDPFEAVGKHVHAQPWSKRAFVNRAQWLLDQVQVTKSDAVILWLLEEEEALPWHVPAQLAALEQAGIPCCALLRRRWDGKDGAADEIAAFVEGLGQ